MAKISLHIALIQHNCTKSSTKGDLGEIRGEAALRAGPDDLVHSPCRRQMPRLGSAVPASLSQNLAARALNFHPCFSSTPFFAPTLQAQVYNPGTELQRKL